MCVRIGLLIGGILSVFQGGTNFASFCVYDHCSATNFKYILAVKKLRSSYRI